MPRSEVGEVFRAEGSAKAEVQVQRPWGGKGRGEFRDQEKQCGWSRAREAEGGVGESGDCGRAPE